MLLAHGVQTPTNRVRHVGAVGLVELTVGEDYLPLHELSTNSKRTTCLPPHMVCEVHHTKSGYEQSESRKSPCRPARSSTSPKRMRYDRFRSRAGAAGHLPARGDRRWHVWGRSSVESRPDRRWSRGVRPPPPWGRCTRLVRPWAAVGASCGPTAVGCSVGVWTPPWGIAPQAGGAGTGADRR